MWRKLWSVLDGVLGVLFWAFLGAILGGFFAYGGGAAYGELANVSNFEGMYGYAVMFGMVPAGAALGTTICGIYGIVRWRRSRPAPQT